MIKGQKTYEKMTSDVKALAAVLDRSHPTKNEYLKQR